MVILGDEGGVNGLVMDGSVEGGGGWTVVVGRIIVGLHCRFVGIGGMG